MSKMDSDPSGSASVNISTDRELRQLYDQMALLHPKIVRNIEECVEKHRMSPVSLYICFCPIAPSTRWIVEICLSVEVGLTKFTV